MFRASLCPSMPIYARGYTIVQYRSKPGTTHISNSTINDIPERIHKSTHNKWSFSFKNGQKNMKVM